VYSEKRSREMKPDFSIVEEKFWAHVYRDKVTFHGESISEDLELTWKEIFELAKGKK